MLIFPDQPGAVWQKRAGDDMADSCDSQRFFDKVLVRSYLSTPVLELLRLTFAIQQLCDSMILASIALCSPDLHVSVDLKKM